jgi:hypothetical protein
MVLLSTTNDSTEPEEIVARRIVVAGPAVNNGYYRACVNNEVRGQRDLTFSMASHEYKISNQHSDMHV